MDKNAIHGIISKRIENNNETTLGHVSGFEIIRLDKFGTMPTYSQSQPLHHASHARLTVRPVRKNS